MPVILILAQLAGCDPAASAAVREAHVLAEAFDLAGALRVARQSAGCDAAEGAAEFAEGLLAAREAAKAGGTVESLRDVRSAANALSRRAEGGRRRWEAASMALRAAAAASQDERDEMAVYLAEAIRQELLLLAAGEPGVPLVSAHELAGELFLDVDRYEQARAAFDRAAEQVGRTGRVRLGRARAAAKLDDPATACHEYRGLLDWWGERSGIPPEIEEARSWLRTRACPR